MTEQLYQFLSCPACGEECRGLPASRPTPDWPDGCWLDGDTGRCQCGAEVRAEADGERAWLELEET